MVKEAQITSVCAFCNFETWPKSLFYITVAHCAYPLGIHRTQTFGNKPKDPLTR